MTAKRVCGYEQTITRIHNYGYTYDKRGNLVKEEEICSPTTTGPETITIATYKYDETNRMVQGTNKLVRQVSTLSMAWVCASGRS